MFNLYENIKDLCKERGTNVSSMCEAIGVSKSTLSNLKNGRTISLSAKTIAKISEYLDVMPEEVLGNEALHKEFDLLVHREEVGEDVSDELNAARIGVIVATNISADAQQIQKTEQKEKPTAQGDGLDSLSDFERSVIELYRNDPAAKAQIDLAVELAKRKTAQTDG